MTTKEVDNRAELDWDQVGKAVHEAASRFRALKTKYPELKGYLSFVSRLGEPLEQADVTAGPVGILEQYPGMIVDGAAKREALALAARSRGRETKRTMGPDADADKDARARLDALCGLFRYRGATEIQISFADIDHALVRRLRVDDLVDRFWTPALASVRICIGTLATLQETRRAEGV